MRDRSDAGCVTFPDRCKAVPLKKKPTEYLRQLYYDTIIFTPEALRHLAREVGVEPDHARHRLSVPVGQGRAVDHILNTPGLSDDDKRAMLGETAAKLLGIKPLAEIGRSYLSMRRRAEARGRSAT